MSKRLIHIPEQTHVVGDFDWYVGSSAVQIDGLQAHLGATITEIPDLRNGQAVRVVTKNDKYAATFIGASSDQRRAIVEFHPGDLHTIPWDCVEPATGGSDE